MLHILKLSILNRSLCKSITTKKFYVIIISLPSGPTFPFSRIPYLLTPIVDHQHPGIMTSLIKVVGGYSVKLFNL